MTTISLLRAFRRRTDGSTAVEAVFIIPIFLALVLSTFEVGWVFLRTSIVETTASDAARLVMTGRAPRAGATASTTCASGSDCFYQQICDRLELFGQCDEHLSVEVRSFSTVTEAANYTTATTCPNAPGYDRAGVEYNPGNRNSYSLVRICFLAPTFNPLLGISLADNADGTKAIIAVQLRRNEPFLGNDQINPNEVQ